MILSLQDASIDNLCDFIQHYLLSNFRDHGFYPSYMVPGSIVDGIPLRNRDREILLMASWVFVPIIVIIIVFMLIMKPRSLTVIRKSYLAAREVAIEKGIRIQEGEKLVPFYSGRRYNRKNAQVSLIESKYSAQRYYFIFVGRFIEG
jgi:hypothetical protein